MWSRPSLTRLKSRGPNPLRKISFSWDAFDKKPDSLASTEPRDRFSSRVKNGRMESAHSAHDEDLASPPSIYKTDLDPFHTSRPQLDPGLAASSGTKREQLIFTTLLDSIFSKKSAAETQSNSQGPTDTSIQTLFQQSLQNDIDLDQVSADVLKTPLSGPLISPTGQSAVPDADKAASDAHLKAAQPVLKHIDGLNTDQELVDYYTQSVLDRWNDHADKQSSALPSGEVSDTAAVANPALSVHTVSLYLLRTMLGLVACRAPERALAVFELSKRSALDLYLAACTVPVYNEAVRIRWIYYRDLYAVESLLSEMHVNAVRGNSDTIAILSDIHREYVAAKHGMSSGGSLAIWNPEDSRRMKSLNEYRMRIARDQIHSETQTFMRKLGVDL